MMIDWEVTQVMEEVTSDDRLGSDRGSGRSDQ